MFSHVNILFLVFSSFEKSKAHIIGNLGTTDKLKQKGFFSFDLLNISFHIKSTNIFHLRNFIYLPLKNPRCLVFLS